MSYQKGPGRKLGALLRLSTLGLPLLFSMTEHQFVASAYFSRDGRFKYVTDSFDDAMKRARFWYDLFIREWGGYSVEGVEVTSICVRKPCGTEVELMSKRGQ